ncbi:hypothetical protein B0A66_01270 [Flavobacterium hercynium]|uniref:Uncharacterized protein n=1 Tax=Flavobacterium hercynium TaxID=387094 RepID=A0A226HRH7_9FLAO|nr:hypothetical protein B0A66_01270 [Flavobacterium hercynium]
MTELNIFLIILLKKAGYFLSSLKENYLILFFLSLKPNNDLSALALFVKPNFKIPHLNIIRFLKIDFTCVFQFVRL